jgi:hypothetical protein
VRAPASAPCKAATPWAARTAVAKAVTTRIITGMRNLLKYGSRW